MALWLLCTPRPHPHLVARQPALQQQAEAVAGLLVVLQALTEATVVVLHQPTVHDHLQLA